MKHYRITEFAQLIGKSAQTLRNWEKDGTLVPSHKTASGYRYYTQEQLNEYLGLKVESRKVVGYCRVSSSKQKDDLERQVENMRMYLLAKGQPFEIVTDIGSGINYRNKGLLRVIDEIAYGRVSKVCVLYKDRLLRFGFELVEHFAALYNCDIEVIDTTEKTEEQELVEDLIQIITVFSCKLQGKRARKTKRMVEELITSDDGDD